MDEVTKWIVRNKLREIRKDIMSLEDIAERLRENKEEPGEEFEYSHLIRTEETY